MCPARYEWAKPSTKSPDKLEKRLLANSSKRASSLDAIPSADLSNLLKIISLGSQPKGSKWLPLGPSVITGGQPVGRVSGRVRAMAVSPDGQRIYSGSANGGLWYSSNGGEEWSPVGSWGLQTTSFVYEITFTNLTIGALDVHFGAAADGSEDSVYVATGELYGSDSITPGGNFAGIGILRLKGPITTAVNNRGTNPWEGEAKNLTGLGISALVHRPDANFSSDPTISRLFVAATNEGLFYRDGPFVADANWPQVASAPFDGAGGGELDCTDVVWNSAGLFVAVSSSDKDLNGVYHSATGVAGPFKHIALPKHKLYKGRGKHKDKGERIRIAAADDSGDHIYALSVKDGESDGHSAIWKLELSSSSAVELKNVPRGIFSSEVKKVESEISPYKKILGTVDNQNHHDNAISAMIEGGKTVLYVGGSTIYSEHPSHLQNWHAQIYRFEVSGTAVAGDLAVNFDLRNERKAYNDATFFGHNIHADVHALVARGDKLFAATDGGIFRRNADRTVNGLNTGMAVTETGYIASHPTVDGLIVAGTQDNGTIMRIGDSSWQLADTGDGGGVVFHAGDPRRIFRQYVNSYWNGIPKTAPVAPLKKFKKSEKKLYKEENEDSSFYSSADTAPSSDPNISRIAFGTTRLWYSDNWNSRENKMKWMTLPSMKNPLRGRTRDAKFKDRILTKGVVDPVLAVKFMDNKSIPAAHFHNTKILVLCERSVRLFKYDHPTKKWTTLDDSLKSGLSREPTSAFIYLDYLPRHNTWTDIAPHDANAESFYVSTLGHFRRVLRAYDGSTTVDPLYDTLWWYNGSGRWYQTRLSLTPPDVTKRQSGVAASAHSVIVDPTDKSIVYVGTRVGVFKGVLDTSGTHPSWTWEPFMTGAPIAPVEDLSIFNNGMRKYLRAALTSRGVWESDISPTPNSVGLLSIRAAPYDTGRVPLPAVWRHPIENTLARFDRSPDLLITNRGAHPWGSKPPTETDFIEHFNYVVNNDNSDLWILAHYRDTIPLAPNDITAHVFMRALSDEAAIKQNVTNPWRSAVLNRIGGGSDTLPDNWRYLGAAAKPARPIEARMPRAMKLEVNLAGAYGTTNSSRFMLILVLLASKDRPIKSDDLTGATFEEIVRPCPIAAALSLRG